MPVTINFQLSDIGRLRKKIHEERKSLDERERALDLVEEMLKSEMGRQPGLELDLPPAKNKNWTDQVKEAILALGEREWGVADIEAVLVQRGVPLPRKNPRSRIAMIVKALRDERLIERTFEAEGQPHRYKTTALGLV